YVSGRGERMQKSNLSLKGKSVVLVKPNIRISTKEAYACVRPKPTEVDYEDLPDLRLWKDVLKNDFEDSLFPKYPVLSEIKQMLYDNGALYASLSGSGATVFGIFEKEIDLERLKQGDDTFIWQGVLR
ncbi:MAG: 4-(cytidine 5'-diphospho)-2-C-methyl-D-erythritol kinase, partial [Bacteroidales bacterium]|nr:4-(cytidine 5'-diphospho)-2-C-methyl-D-erythritol kinase [Bacteroidales bacterium]